MVILSAYKIIYNVQFCLPEGPRLVLNPIQIFMFRSATSFLIYSANLDWCSAFDMVANEPPDSPVAKVPPSSLHFFSESLKFDISSVIW